MSHPIRPPTDNLKFNVLLMYACLALSVGATIVFEAHGAWRWLVVVPATAVVWLFVRAVRAGTERDTDLT